MPSPFPGMDPYLEDPAFWRGFHGELVYSLRSKLLGVLPDGYDAEVEEQVRLIEVQEDDEEPLVVVVDRLPDVAVTRGAAPVGQGHGRPGAATLEPELELKPVVVTVPPYVELRQRRIRVVHLPERSLVTAVEVLSPTNKTGTGFGEYQAKRRALLRQKVNLVEIDLLQGGRRPEAQTSTLEGDCYVVVSRAARPTERQVFVWSIRRALPRVLVPLAAGDPDVVLDLAVAFDEAYDRGGHGRRLRYAGPPPAALRDDDRAWALDLATRRAREGVR